MTQATINIRCLNIGHTITVAEGSSLLNICRQYLPEQAAAIVSARVNNKAQGLCRRLYDNADVEFLTIKSKSGMRTYTRSLLFVLAKAVEDIYDGVHVSVEAPVSNGYYIYLRHAADVSVSIDAIRQRMDEIIAADYPFVEWVKPTDEVIKTFEEYGMHSCARLLKSTNSLYTTYYTLDGYPDCYYGALCPSAGYIRLYGLESYHNGLLLRLPDPDNEGQLMPLVRQDKMLEVFDEHHHWQDLGRVRTIADLNEICGQGYTNDLINVSEALQEKKICHIADAIQAKGSVRLVLIAGPSSSGKTTFSKRLSVQLMASGLRPRPISMDDYFLPRKQTPRDANGNYDFESIEALNLPLLGDHLQKLLSGQEVELPRYDFQTGESLASGVKMQLMPNEILIMEGIHALNPKLTASLSNDIKYKVYVSALTTIQLDNHNYIPTSDNRLLRRMVRDYKYRGYSAQETIKRWPSVTGGEKIWIFPFQEEADAMFNSALLFELAGLRSQALPLLEQVPENAPEHAEAHRLTNFLRYINPIDISSLPPASLLREFLGGSSFHY